LIAVGILERREFAPVLLLQGRRELDAACIELPIGRADVIARECPIEECADTVLMAVIYRLPPSIAHCGNDQARHVIGKPADHRHQDGSQLYYQQKDCKNAVAWGDRAVAAFKKAGEASKEVLYQIKLQCAADADETTAEISALYDLVRLTNKTSYWNNLIRLERQDERDDHNTLMIYRVMYDTGAMLADTDYIEMAQLLGDAALPGEAQMVLEKLMSTSGVLKDEHGERTTRLLNAMKSRADADKHGLPALEAEAITNPAGQLDVKLGEVCFGAGDYRGAATAINRGLGKGQIKQPDEAYVYLGRYWMAQNNPTEARKTFEHLRTLPNISARVLRLWNLYADVTPGAPPESP
jgi:tetratricopeptide (TPR) repeat protein